MLTPEKEKEIRDYVADSERYGLPINWVNNIQELFDEIDRLRKEVHLCRETICKLPSWDDVENAKS